MSWQSVVQLDRSEAREWTVVVLHRLKSLLMIVLGEEQKGHLQFLIPTNSSMRPS